MKPLSDLIYESEAGLIEPETTPLGNGGMNQGLTPCMLMSCQGDGGGCANGAAAPVIPLSASSKCN
ncbi:MAG: hypothetical protein ILP13_04930 [Lachnospiraceae bacterium]|nr:hypothetical protein [Lachnospiraceae bacterium]